MSVLEHIQKSASGWVMSRTVLIATAVSVVLVAVAAFWLVSQETETRKVQIEERANLLALSLEEEIRTTFDFADTYLKLIRAEYQRNRNAQALSTLMNKVPLPDLLYSHVTVVDKTGKPIFNSQYEIRADSSASDRQYFRHFVNSTDDDLFISLPHEGRNSGKIVVRAVRRLSDAQGGFDGVIFVAIDADRMVKFFRELELGEESSATVVGLDKRIRSRSHYGRLGPGQDISGSRIWTELAIKPVGSYRQTSVVDGVERIYSYRQLASYPLIVAIGVPLDFISQSEQDVRLMAFGFGGLAIIVIILLASIAIRESVNTRRLRVSNTAKDQFLGHMSHELRTPLNSIIGFSEIISLETFGKSNNPKYVEYGNLINFASNHLLRIINDILDLMKIEAGERRCYPEWITLEEVYQETGNLLGARAREKNLTLELKLPDHLPRIWVDGMMLRQILVNLVGNAIKFVPDGGEITVQLDQTKTGGISISVIDNGPGIAQDDLPKVLKPFEQVRDTVFTSASGTGLGLPLSKMMTELNGGTLIVISTVGQGTCVIVSFPAQLVEAQS